MTDRTVITTRGLQLLARLASGAEQLEFTGVKVGTGIVPDGTDPAQLMHLVSYKMDGMIADYGYDQETDDAFVVMQITNAGITSGFVMTEVGLFAMDPDRGEILYAYVDLSEDPNYIMPEENGRAKTVQIKMHVVVGEAADITATINPLSQVTMEVFQRELGKKTDSEGGDISEAVAGFETPGAEIKYPELEPGGSVKGILGGMKRWLETLKKEKVTADGGEAGETTATFEDYTGDTPAPSVETALANIRSKGKTGNILSNIKAALMGLVTLGEMRKHLVNNGLCTEPGKFFLDAAYGKTLMDEITRLNGEARTPTLPTSSFVEGRKKAYIKCNGSDGNVFLPYLSLPVNNGYWQIGSHPVEDWLVFQYITKDGVEKHLIIEPPNERETILGKLAIGNEYLKKVSFLSNSDNSKLMIDFYVSNNYRYRLELDQSGISLLKDQSGSFVIVWRK